MKDITYRRYSELFIAILLVVGIVFYALYHIRGNREEEIQRLEDSLNATLNTTNYALNTWYEERKIHIKSVANNEEVVQFAEELLDKEREKVDLVEDEIQSRIRNYFYPVLKDHLDHGIFIISPSRVSLSSMRDGNIGTKNLIAIQKPEVLERVFNGETLLITPIESDLPIRTRKQHESTMFMATPIWNEKGEVIAVFTLRLDPSETLSRATSIGCFGKSGEVYAFNEQGILVTESRHNQTGVNSLELKVKLINPETKDFIHSVENALNKQNGSNMKGYDGFHGKKVMGTWVWNSSLDLGITAEIDLDEGLSYHLKYSRSLVFGTFIISVLLLSVAYILYRNRRKKELINRKIFAKLRARIEDKDVQFQNIFRNSYEGILALNPRGEINLVNKSLGRIFEYSEEELIGNPISMLMPERFRSAHTDHVGMFFKNLETRQMGGRAVELVGRTKSGREFPIDVSLSSATIQGEMHAIAFVLDVSNRKKQEKALLAGKARLNEAQRIGKFGDWEWDFETNKITLSNNLCALLELDLSDNKLDYDYFLGLFEHEDKVSCETLKDEVFVNGDPFEWAVSRKNGKGEKVYFSVKGEVIKNEEGAVEKLLGTIQNVTDLEKNRQLLEKSEKRLKNAQRISKLGNWEYNHIDNKLFWSDEVYSLFGIEEREITYEGFLNLIHPDDRENVDSEYMAHVSTKKPYSVQHRIILPNGDLRYVQEECYSEYDDNGNVLKSIGTIQDITESKRSEFKIREALDEIRQNEERIKLATSSGKIGIFDWGVKENVLIWDDSMFDLYEVDKSGGLSVFESWKNALHPEDLPRVLDEISLALNNEKEFNTEYRVLNWDSIKHIRAIASVQFDEEGSAIRMTGANIDITRLKEAEADLKKAKEQAETANESKSQFLAKMSHEIRTPMNAILGYTQILEQSENLNQSQYDNLRSIYKSGEHLLTIINEILEMSKLEANKVELNQVHFDLHALLKEVYFLLRVSARNKNISMKLDLSDDLPIVVFADEQRIRQVIINLLSNAIKFTKQGGVELSAKLKGKLVEIDVKDSGPGIPKKVCDKIFEPFEQMDMKYSSKMRGTGLGLSISRELAHLLGGDVTVKSDLDIGSTFKFTFTYLTGDEDLVTNVERYPRIVKLKREYLNTPVMLIAGHEKQFDFIHQAIESIGFSIIIARNDESIQQQMATSKPKIMVLDVSSRELDHKPLIHRLEDEQLDGIPMLAISDMADEELNNLLRKKSITIVHSPVKISELLENVKRLIHIEYEDILDYEKNYLKKSMVVPENIPDELIEQFVHGIKIGDVDKLNQLNEELAAIEGEFASYLDSLINDFNFEELLELLKPT